MKFNGVLYSDWPSVVTGLFIFTSKWRNNIAKNYRVNDRIRVPSVLLVDDKGNQLGEMSTPDAIALASERGLDLVEVAPAAEPPVCRILNYGKFRYEATRKEGKQSKI